MESQHKIDTAQITMVILYKTIMESKRIKRLATHFAYFFYINLKIESQRELGNSIDIMHCFLYKPTSGNQNYLTCAVWLKEFFLY